MWRFLAVCLASIALTSAIKLVDQDPHVDFKPLKSSADRIREHGYPAESHFVETSDGYVLNLFRIPYSPKLNNKDEKRPPILLQHGLFSCSDCFLLSGPNDALAYVLADAGFDVWLGNARGNIYSRNNTKISPEHPYFWRFSWHEIAVIDLPESIDYILALTGEKTMHYGGHSQGTTVYFVLLSERPEYNAKIRTGHMLAPSTYMTNSQHILLTRLWPYVGEPGLGTILLDDQQFMPSNPQVQRALDTACGGSPNFPEFCRTLFFLFAGPDEVFVNTTLLPQVAETHPAGISANQGIHYIQLHLSEKFRQYDHGVKKNLKYYGQPEPPEYEVEKVTAATYMYYSLADKSTNYTDVEFLRPRLSNVKYFGLVPEPEWSHIDFIMGMDVKAEVNDKVVNFCLEWEEENAKNTQQ